MMVTWVHGFFKDIHGEIEFEPNDPVGSKFSDEIDLTKIWTGEPDRDKHLRATDFFDAEQFPGIRFEGEITERIGENTFKAGAELTIRGNTRTVPLDVCYLGEWKTNLWENGENKGELRRIGFEASARINRHNFGVSWQDELPGGGIVVSNEISLILNAEAIDENDLKETGAISYFRPAG